MQFTGDLEEDLELLERWEEEQEDGSDSDDDFQAPLPGAGARIAHPFPSAVKPGLGLRLGGGAGGAANSDGSLSDSAEESPTIPALRAGPRPAPPALRLGALESSPGAQAISSLGAAQKPAKAGIPRLVPIVADTTAGRLPDAAPRLPLLALPAARSTLAAREAAARADQEAASAHQEGAAAHERLERGRPPLLDLPGQRHRRRRSGVPAAGQFSGAGDGLPGALVIGVDPVVIM